MFKILILSTQPSASDFKTLILYMVLRFYLIIDDSILYHMKCLGLGLIIIIKMSNIR